MTGVYMSAMPNSIIIIHFIKCIAEFSHFYPIFNKNLSNLISA